MTLLISIVLLYTKGFFEHLLVKADDNLFAGADGGGAKVVGWAKDKFFNYIPGDIFFFKVNVHRLFSFGGVQMTGEFKKLFSILFFENIFSGVNDFRGIDFMFGEKLPRSGAGGSAVAEIKPVDFGHGMVSFLIASYKISPPRAAGHKIISSGRHFFIA